MRVKVTAKAKAVTPNSAHQTKLIEFLKAYRNWTQYVVNEIWYDEKLPSMRKLHNRFYSKLRTLGFRAHHCHKIERRAKEIVKSIRKQWLNKLREEVKSELRRLYGKKKLTRSEREFIEELAEEIAQYQLNQMIKSGEFKVSKTHSGRPILRKLTARLDYEDYKLDLKNRVLKVAVLNGEWVELKLQWYSYLDRYSDGSWKPKEILVSYRNNTIWAHIVFEKEVALRQPRTIMGIDINFNNITHTIVDSRGKLLSMGVILFKGLRRMLHFKKLAENLQRKYLTSWKNLKRVREVRRRWFSRGRNILIDSCHYVSKRIVKIAREYDALLVLEDLTWLKFRGNGGSRFNWENQLWCYRRIQEYIKYKALLSGLPVVYVDAKGTSKTSPIGDRLSLINYRWVKLPSGVITSRDMVASWNLALRGLKRMKGTRGKWCPDSPLNEAMKLQAKRGKPVQVVSKIPKVSKR